MWTAYLLSRDGARPIPIARADLAAALRGRGFLWVDLESPTLDEAKILTDPFHFHPLAIEDALSPRLNAPKIDEHGSYLFIVTQGVNGEGSKDQPEMREVDFFIGPNYLVTFHLLPVHTIERARNLWLEGLWQTLDSPDSLAHLIADRIVDDFLPILEALEEEVETMEEGILQLTPQEISTRVPPLKKSLGRIQRATTPQREVFHRLSRSEWPVIQEKNLLYFRDIYDHLLRLDATVDGLHQRTDLALQLHLGAVSNRTNEVLKVLSLVGTIFLPLTFLVGVWGMNFQHMPELEWRYGYLIAWAIMLLLTFGMIGYFRWRRWL